MDHIKLDLYLGEATSCGYISGELTIPADFCDISKLISTECKVNVDSTSCEKDSIHIKGTALFTVYYINTKGSVDCFTSSAYFTHSLDAKNITTDMDFNISTSIEDITASITEPRKVMAKAVVRFSTDITQKQIIQGNNFDNYEVLREEIIINDKSTPALKELVISDDVRISQGLPGVDKLLNTRAYGKILTIHTEGQKAVVAGEIRLCTTYMAEDNIWQTNSTIPFEEIIEADRCIDEYSIISTIDIKDVTATSNDPYILSFDIVALIKLIPVQKFAYPVTTDAYSLNTATTPKMVDLSYKTLVLDKNIKFSKNHKADVSSVNMAKPVCVFALPIIHNVFATENNICFDGKVICDILYKTQDDQFDSFKIVIPLDETLGVTNIKENMSLTLLNPNMEQINVVLSGDELDIKCSMSAVITAYSPCNKSIVSSVEDGESLGETRTSILVYFKDKEETNFSIGKKFHIPQKDVDSQNDKLILLNCIK